MANNAESVYMSLNAFGNVVFKLVAILSRPDLNRSPLTYWRIANIQVAIINESLLPKHFSFHSDYSITLTFLQMHWNYQICTLNVTYVDFKTKSTGINGESLILSKVLRQGRKGDSKIDSVTLPCVFRGYGFTMICHEKIAQTRWITHIK